MGKYVWRLSVTHNGFPPQRHHITSSPAMTDATIDAIAYLDRLYSKPKAEKDGGGHWSAAEMGYDLIGIERIIELDDVQEQDGEET